jgi:hypothetical protein
MSSGNTFQELKQHLSEIWIVIKDPIFIKQMLWITLLVVLMLISILANIDFLKTNYPDDTLTRPGDRVLDAIPPNYDFLQIGETVSRLEMSVVAFFFLTSTQRLRRLPKMLFLLCVMFILRGFAITLTPLAQITPPGEHFPESNFIAQNFYHGMFFSGHSSSALIQAFFFWPYRFKGIRITWFILPIAIMEVISMIWGHQHYSIDIFTAFFVVYFVMTFEFMRLVPKSLLEVKWMPWWTGEEVT